jgi:peptidoglycan/xylan/chitin deacetylase (PgdA/CDA1 family)
MKRFETKRQLKLIVSLLYYGICQIRQKVSKLLGRPQKPRLTILYYHSVRPEERKNFARQMAALHKGARVVAAAFRGKLQPHCKHVAITFDDAFVSFAENALPELALRSFPCTVFVPVGALGHRPSWAMESCCEDREEIVMTREHLLKLPSSMVELGTHTITHPHLTQLDQSQARTEIEACRAQLEKLTGRDIRLFSFPYGEFNEKLVQICRDARYESIFTVVPKEVDTSTPDLVRGRVRVDPSDGLLEFYLKFNGAYAWAAHFAAWRHAVAGG